MCTQANRIENMQTDVRCEGLTAFLSHHMISFSELDETFIIIHLIMIVYMHKISCQVKCTCPLIFQNSVLPAKSSLIFKTVSKYHGKERNSDI